MAPPDVLWRHTDGVFDDTARAWDARSLRPLVSEPVETEPLTHAAGCRMAPWPDLADLCPCTANVRYPRRHVDQFGGDDTPRSSE